ncbi:hypothetical protein MPDQ_001054 [Monascus purpureus]|uniref:Protein kinase domain-containing protein n=1 Tax=Monascus purpureus TaxID=5098 RepID=A0A507QND9_MONPU|nr:hypothetical protein MPDQ_001054 [Monascus purpureus]
MTQTPTMSSLSKTQNKDSHDLNTKLSKDDIHTIDASTNKSVKSLSPDWSKLEFFRDSQDAEGDLRLTVPEFKTLTLEPLTLDTPSPTSSHSSPTILPYTPPRFAALRAASDSVRSFFRRPSPNALGKRPVRSVLELFPTATSSNSEGVSSSHLTHLSSVFTNTTQPNSDLRWPPTPMSPSTSFTESGSSGSSAGSRFKMQAASAPGFCLKESPRRFLIPHPHRKSLSLSNIGDYSERPGLSIPTVRQMSSSLLGDLEADSCKLSDEFVTASMFPGIKGKEIGKGSTAIVRIIYQKGSSKPYAVKEFRKQGRNETQEEYEKKVKSEFSIANSLHHPNIVKTIRLCTHAGRWNHVMEYCSQGELFSLVQKNYLRMDDNMCLFKQLLRGVAYLHRNGVAHRDIKLENLLLSEDGHLKISDFGVSVVFRGRHPGSRYAYVAHGEVRRCAPGICGSRPYIAPEVLAMDGMRLFSSPPLLPYDHYEPL